MTSKVLNSYPGPLAPQLSNPEHVICFLASDSSTVLGELGRGASEMPLTLNFHGPNSPHTTLPTAGSLV